MTTLAFALAFATDGFALDEDVETRTAPPVAPARYLDKLARAGRTGEPAAWETEPLELLAEAYATGVDAAFFDDDDDEV